MARPRSVRAHEDVVKAALALFAERGIDATSMDAIADASGVSKATIYKHWPDKDALCLEVMAYSHGHGTTPPVPDSGDLYADLLAAISYEPPKETAELRARMMPHLMAYAARHPAFAKAWRGRVLDPPRLVLAEVLKNAIARGDLTSDLDVEVALALLLGPMMYNHVIKLSDRKPPQNLREIMIDAFVGHYGQSRRVRPAPREPVRTPRPRTPAPRG